MLRGLYDRGRRVPYEKLEWMPGVPVFLITPDIITEDTVPTCVAIEPHWHKSLEIIYTNESTAQLCVDGNLIDLGPQSLFVLTPRVVHGYPEARSDYTGCTLQIAYEFVREVIPAVDDCRFTPSDEGRAHALPLLFELVRYCKEDDPANREVILSLCRAFLLVLARYCLVSGNPTTLTATEGDRLLESIVSYLDYHFTEDISLGALANQFNISYSYLARLVKEHLGMSAKQYLTNKRYAQGHFLLVTTERSVTEIAHDAGFPSANAFIREFKRRDGVTPEAYRKRLLASV